MKKRARTKSPAKAKKSAKRAPKRDSRAVKTYEPTPIQGIGWAPFRYPLS